MANDKDIKIGIQTQADTAGIDKAVVSIGRLSSRQADLRSETGSLSERFDITKTATHDLDAAVNRTTKSTESFTAGVTQAGKSTRNSAQALLMFSQGFEDAQYGIRGVLNNIPSLIFAMGGSARLAAAINIAAVAGSQLFSMLSKTEEKASDMADRIKEIAANMGDAELDRFDDVGESIELAADAAAALKQNWDAVKMAETAAAESALTNSEKLQAAQRLVAELLGLQVDRFRELEVIQLREAARRQQAAEAAIAAEKAKEKAALDAVSEAADLAGKTELRLASEQSRLVQLQAQLRTLKDQKKELEEIAALGDAGIRYTAPGDLPDPNAANDFIAGLAARRTLDSPEFQTQLAGTQAQVDKLEESIRKLADENSGAVVRAGIALDAARTKAADVSAAVEINIRRIEETFAADQTLARVQDIAKKSELNAKELTAAVADLNVGTAQGKTAKAAILAAAEDGKITAQESLDVANNLRTLIGLIQSNQEGSNSNVMELLTLQKQTAMSQASLRTEMQSLRHWVAQATGREP